MATLTVNIPKELKDKMDAMPEINWTKYLKERLEIRAKQLMKFQNMVRNGEI